LKKHLKKWGEVPLEDLVHMRHKKFIQMTRVKEK